MQTLFLGEGRGRRLSEQLSGFGIFTLCWAALVTLFVCIKSVFNARSWRFPFALSLPLTLSQLLSLSLSLFQLDENALLQQLAEHERALLFGTQAGKCSWTQQIGKISEVV